MKKFILLLSACMFLIQLHAQQTPNSPVQDATTLSIEASQCLENIAKINSDEALVQQAFSSNETVLDSIPITEIDTTQSPTYRASDVSPPDEDGVENEYFIVELDDFQSLQAMPKKNRFLSLLSNLFKRRKAKNDDMMTAKL